MGMKSDSSSAELSETSEASTFSLTLEATDDSGAGDVRSYTPFVDGELRPHTGDWINLLDPATEAVVARCARCTAADVDVAVSAARRAMAGPWSRMKPAERGVLLRRLADLLRRDAERIAWLETSEVGKAVSKARGDVATAAATLEFYAGAVDKVHGETIPLDVEHIDLTVLEPLGVTAHIVPWNSPLAMTVRSLAPAFTAGCTAVIKPAEEACGSVFALAELVAEAGFPAGVVNVVPGAGPEAGAALAGHTDVDGITFTGSVETGRAVMRLASENVTPVVLELGGKSPMVVFADADLAAASADLARGLLVNSGQVCIAASRLIVERSVEREFIDRLRAIFESKSIGPGADDPDIAPLVSEAQLSRVMSHVASAKSEGATLVTGGGRPDGLERGYFVKPTIFSGVRPEMRLAREETFGPVLAELVFDDEEEAVSLANDVPFGLAAAVYTSDATRSLRVARRLQAGTVWVNCWGVGGVQAPVGGYKQSGIGREKGMAAIRNYVQSKNVVIRHG